MESKKCTKCEEAKPLAEFRLEKRNKSGVAAICKKCCYADNTLRRKERYYTDPEFRKKRNEAARNKRKEPLDLEKNNATSKAWRAKNKERAKEIAKKSYEKNRAGYIYRARCRKMALKERTPRWLTEFDLFVIECIYDRAKELGEYFGVPFHVDPIIPLQGKTVSGLHCPSNLQILTASKNLSKSNKFTEEKDI